MPNIGTPELILILAVAVLLFGVGRIGKIGGELGSAVRAFREGLAGGTEEQTQSKDSSETPKTDA